VAPEAWTPGPVLGIESSCDETAAAVFEPRWRELSLENGVLSDVIASQVALHAPHGGIVPELASRQHLRDIRAVVEEALERAGLGLSGLSGLAVTAGPGLVGALLVGVSFAKSLQLATGLPLAPVHHLDGHVRSAFLERDEPEEPYLALVVSGGHSALYRVERAGHARRYQRLARTLDDAAGEAYDKVGKLMGLDYPAGPRIDRAAAGHGGERVPFKRARIKVDGGRGVTHRAFSFSGIKTAVRQHLHREGLPPLAEGQALEDRADLLAVLAGFQETVVDMLVRPTLRIASEEGLSHLVVVGGVSANSALRKRLAEDCALAGVELIVPRPRWSTDNAAMIAAAGALQLSAGERAPIDLRADPALPLGVVA
jgi:N6-L-threonylcarbamoyladenine synthase